MNDQIVIVFAKIEGDPVNEWACEIQGMESFIANQGIEGRNAVANMLSTVAASMYHLYAKQAKDYH